jgi:hypothetical protein
MAVPIIHRISRDRHEHRGHNVIRDHASRETSRVVYYG